MIAISLCRVRRAVLVRVGAVGVGLIVAGAGLVGCADDPDAGTNGEGKLSAERIQADTRKSARAAKTVRLAGTVVGKDGTYKLDMRLRENGGAGSVTTKGGTMHLLRVGDHLFLKADAAFWRDSGGRDNDGKGHRQTGAADSVAAEKLSGKYVRVPKDDPSYQQLSGFTDKDVLLDGVLTLHGTLDKGDHGTTYGIRTVEISGDKGAGGTLAVSLEGKPRPVRLERAGGAGMLSFTEWDKPFSLREPAESRTVDYGKALPRS